MSCCPTITSSSSLPSTSAVTYTNLVNVTNTAGVLTKTGGVPGSFDAHADTDTWVEGTGCALWTWTIHVVPPVAAESNSLLYVVYAEDLSYSFGWFFTNAIANFRRSRYDNGALDFAIFYGNSTLGYNRFAMEFNNGTIKLYETNEFAATDPGWIYPASYSKTGLSTAVRYRVRVFLRETVASQSSLMTWALGASGDICSTAAWSFPSLGWTASAEITSHVPRGGVLTERFDSGLGSEYYLVAPVIDSGNELRSKNVKSVHATGKLTNPEVRVYGYDVGDNVNTTDLEDGTNSSTGAVALTDTTDIAQTPRVNLNVPNAVLHTVRLSGDDTGQTERDEIHEIVVEQSEQGVRR